MVDKTTTTTETTTTTDQSSDGVSEQSAQSPDESGSSSDVNPNEGLNTDYYDEIDPDAHALSAENRSAPDREARDLWQSTNVSTDGSGPTVQDVAPVFAQARADQLANPVTADQDDAVLREEQVDDATSAQERADVIRFGGGYVPATGAEAGIYSDPAEEGSVPEENFSAAPEPAEGERTVEQARAEEPVAPTEADTTETDQRAPEAVPADEEVDEGDVADDENAEEASE